MRMLRKYSLLQGNRERKKKKTFSFFHLWMKIKAGRKGNEVSYKVHWQNIHEMKS